MDERQKGSERRTTHQTSLSASLVVIGNEILSGRTQDKNIPFIANLLNEHGIVLSEVRIVADKEEAIIEAITMLRFRDDYVFTTGGIGPTHDDITSRALAKAFCLPLHYDAEALERLRHHYGERLNDARRKMACMPRGSVLIDNPISHAPGYRIENVLVLAGVPTIMQAMLRGALPSLQGGAVLKSHSLACSCAEGDIAHILNQLQKDYADIEIGSYPWFTPNDLGVQLVLRGYDADRLLLLAETLQESLRKQGINVVVYRQKKKAQKHEPEER